MSFIGQGYNPPNPPQPAPPPAPAPLRAAPPSAPKYPAVRPWLFWTMFGCSAALLLSVFLPWVSASVGTVQVSGNGLGGVNSLLPAQGQGLGDGVFLLPVALLGFDFCPGRGDSRSGGLGLGGRRVRSGGNRVFDY